MPVATNSPPDKRATDTLSAQPISLSLFPSLAVRRKSIHRQQLAVGFVSATGLFSSAGKRKREESSDGGNSTTTRNSIYRISISGGGGGEATMAHKLLGPRGSNKFIRLQVYADIYNNAPEFEGNVVLFAGA